MKENMPIGKRLCRGFRPLTAMSVMAAASVANADTFRIEIDYMTTAGHSHMPSAAVIQAVQQMFACEGHNLIIDVDDAIPHHNVLIRNPANCDQSLFTYAGAANSYGSLKNTWYDHDGVAGWHYCIFAHQYEDSDCNTTGSSGLANAVGDFIVTLGGFSGQTGTAFDQAGTLAHEFGHNLGLSHCGNQYCGGDESDPDYVGPYVPNMPSLMSYRYQLAGVRHNMLCNDLTTDYGLYKNLDYSHGRMCALNEDSLNEVVGTVMTSTDWNCNGSLQASVAQDINGTNGGWCGSNGNRTVVSDYNEWSNLVDSTLLPAAETADLAEIEFSCITAEEWEVVKEELELGGCGQPALSTEGCQGGENVWLNTTPFIVEVGTCPFPYDSVIQAHNAMPNNSRFYLRPGTYNEAGSITLNKPGIWSCNTGSALIR